ncbi:MAG: putative sodium-dependent transporter [Chlamydiales bacterium]|jgi:NSS family neurotransmitter:Na+ symporter|nr:putative sodium-dependent transporter [Chlamydiales bacterium]
MNSQDSTTESGWKSEMGYIWSILGSAVGFANVLSFSSQCYKNGGGAFLIPLLIAYLSLGVPMLILEALIGQRYQLPIVSACGRAANAPGRVIGWMSTLSCLTIGGFYAVLTAYAICYSYYALTSQIPADTASFFKASFLKDSGSLAVWGDFSWPVFIGTCGVAAFTAIILCRQIQNGIEKICSIFMPLLTLIIALFALFTTFIPGAFYGISHFLTPDFARLKDPSLWRDVFGHLFFSQSLGLGIITGYSRYAKEQINIRRAMLWVAGGDFIISFLAGWVVFASIGAMSTMQNVPFDSLVKTDSIFEMGFIIFPQVIALSGPLFSPFLGAIFFFSVFIAGITGVFSITEAVVGNLESEFNMKRQKAVFLTAFLALLISIFFSMGNGQHLLGALAPMVLGINMLIAAAFELIVFIFLSKEMRRAFQEALEIESETTVYLFASGVLFFISVILCGVALQEMQEERLSLIVRWGWLLAAFLIASLLAWKTKRKTA